MPERRPYRARFGLWHGRKFSRHDVLTTGSGEQDALRTAVRGVIRTTQPMAGKEAVRDQLRSALSTMGRHYAVTAESATRRLLSEISLPQNTPQKYKIPRDWAQFRQLFASLAQKADKPALAAMWGDLDYEGPEIVGLHQGFMGIEEDVEYVWRKDRDFKLNCKAEGKDPATMYPWDLYHWSSAEWANEFHFYLHDAIVNSMAEWLSNPCYDMAQPDYERGEINEITDKMLTMLGIRPRR